MKEDKLPDDVSIEPEEGEERSSFLSSMLEWVVVFALAIGLVLAGRNFIAEPYEVPSGSMLETIQIGDRLFGEKISYHFKTPEYKDIVFFISPEDNETVLVKRVIATGGQEIDLRDGIVYVDGEALDEYEYTGGKRSDPLGTHAANLSANLTFPLTVPEDCIWVMGDNRTNSRDSRYFGPVPLKSVEARAFLIYWPFNDFKLF